MLFNIIDYFKKYIIYRKLLYLIISFIFFGIIYYLCCDDTEFGGINLLQEEIRKESVKKFVDKAHKGRITDVDKVKIGEKLKKGDIDKKTSKELKAPEIDKITKTPSKWQKLFDRIYFAIVTGTTLGYGDIYPLSNKIKVLIILQLFTTITIIFY